MAADGFEAFWSRERDRIYRALALSLTDHQLAAEAVDEAMTRALERWSKIGTYQNPAAWVYRVGFNWATSRRRYLAIRPLRRDHEIDRPECDPLPDVDLAAQLAQLRRDHRAAVVLRHFLQFSPTEIGAILEVPVGTAKSYIHRGLAELRELEQERTDG